MAGIGVEVVLAIGHQHTTSQAGLIGVAATTTIAQKEHQKIIVMRRHVQAGVLAFTRRARPHWRTATTVIVATATRRMRLSSGRIRPKSAEAIHRRLMRLVALIGNRVLTATLTTEEAPTMGAAREVRPSTLLTATLVVGMRDKRTNLRILGVTVREAGGDADRTLERL